jgi:hypothetical protein
MEQSTASKAYLAVIFSLSAPAVYYIFSEPSDFGPEWAFLTFISAFVAAVNVRLPKISCVISMGDVFVILSLVYFKAGPALVTYWIHILVGHLSEILRRHGLRFHGKIKYHRFLFNLAGSTLSICAMTFALKATTNFIANPQLSPVVTFFGIALSWFLVNTITLSLAIALWTDRAFLAVWRDGLSLYLLNFMGSAAAAGLIKTFYDSVNSRVIFLAVPIAAILLQLYRFYISKYQQAHKHISDLNTVYLQTVERPNSWLFELERFFTILARSPSPNTS